MDGLTVDSARVGERHVLTLSGPLTSATVDDLTSHAVAALVDRSVRTLILELSAVGFLDSTGIGALVSLHATAADVGVQLVLRHPTSRLVKLLCLIHMDGVFTVDPPLPPRGRATPHRR